MNLYASYVLSLFSTRTLGVKSNIELFCTVKRRVADLERLKQLSFPSLRMHLLEEFEELQNYLLIGKELFYEILITDCHVNEEFINFWRQLLMAYHIVFGEYDFQFQLLPQHSLDVMNRAQVGNYGSVQQLIKCLFSKFNSSECLLQAFKSNNMNRPVFGTFGIFVFSLNHLLKNIQIGKSQLPCSKQDLKEYLVQHKTNSYLDPFYFVSISTCTNTI